MGWSLLGACVEPTQEPALGPGHPGGYPPGPGGHPPGPGGAPPGGSPEYHGRAWDTTGLASPHPSPWVTKGGHTLGT